MMNRKRDFFRNSEIEIINPAVNRGRIKFAIFDFDGTISLIRSGWQDIMIPMMVDILLETPGCERKIEIEKIVLDYVALTTGKQTIYQMIRLAEEILKRGGNPKDPLDYKNQYHDQLMNHIHARVEGLRLGTYLPEDWTVSGSLDMLEAMKKLNITCFLASGTDEKYVVDEADLLGISKYFNCLYGAIDDYKNFSKKLVIRKIIQDNQLTGPELIAFGDGYVEIEDTKSAGGIAVGVATNEDDKEGINEWKRERLIASGADIIIPDFSQFQALLDYLWEGA